MSMGVIWLIGFVAFLAIEAVSYQIVSVWFAIGTIGGLIAYLCGGDLYVQLIVFIALSVIMLALLRPLSVKLFGKKQIKTNADSLIGKTVLITQEVNNIRETGQGKLSGMVWTVRSDAGEVIPEGETATVLRIEGVKLIVEGGNKNVE